MPMPNSCHGRLNHSILTAKMPISANPRSASSSPIRSPAATGAGMRPPRPSAVIVSTGSMHVAVGDFFGIGLAHIHDLLIEPQILAGHGMVQIHIHHAHAYFLHGHWARAEAGIEHHLHARRQALLAEMLLRYALAHVLAALAIGIGSRDIGAEALTCFAPFQRLLEARNDVAVAEQDRQRFPILRAFRRLLPAPGCPAFEHGVVKTDGAVFFDLHGRNLGGAAGAALVSGVWVRPRCRP